MYFPEYRPRRLRQNENFRRLIRETKLSVDDLIYPLFVVPGSGVKKPISSLPGQYHFSIDKLVEEAKRAQDLGLPGIILFGLPEKKDERGTEAYSDKGIVQRAIRAIKKEAQDLLVITDVCLCEYTSHGHCGLIAGQEVLNDPTLDLLVKTALSHVWAGADMVAPSDMMDGRVTAIRTAFEQEGLVHTPIMAYSAKYASAFYGPFREAAGSAPAFGDRRSYQMDPANGREALREALLDLDEGADIIMVKPALGYLDVLARIKDKFNIPLAAYNVSGEYVMVKAAVAQGLMDEKRTVLEILTSIKRAGADMILTYHAPEAATWLTQA